MQAPRNLRLGPTEWALLLFLSFLWGGSFFFVEVVVEALPPLTLVVLRVGLAALALWPVVALRGIPVPRTRRAWTDFAVMASLNNVAPFTLIAHAQDEIAGGLAAILNASAPLWTVIFANFMTADEKATKAKVLGVVVGMGGVAAIVGPAAWGVTGYGLLPPLAVLAATVLYGFTGVFGRRLGGYDPIMSATGQLTCATLIGAPLAVVVDRPWGLTMPGAPVLLSLLALALFSTALAYIVFFRILRTAGATNVLLVTLLAPITAVLLGAAFLGERLEPRAFVGMALVGAGLAVIDGRPWRFLKERLARPAG